MKKHIIISAITALSLAACGQDLQKDASNDFIDAIKPQVEAAGLEFTPELESCLRGVVEGLSDDELIAVSDQAETMDPEVMAEVTSGVQDCMLAVMPTP